MNKIKKQIEDKLGVTIPGNIPIPQIVPSNEWEWFQLIDTLIYAQKGQNEMAVTDPTFEQLSRKTAQSLLFWAEHICKRYHLAMPDKTPADGQMSWSLWYNGWKPIGSQYESIYEEAYEAGREKYKDKPNYGRLARDEADKAVAEFFETKVKPLIRNGK